MADLQKFDVFVADVAAGVHNLNVDVLKVMLTNVEPSGLETVKGELRELEPGNGYTRGGHIAAFRSGTQVRGAYTLVLNSPEDWTFDGGPMGPFRYAVLYNDTAPRKPLIGFWDYGVSVSLLQPGETFAVDLDQGAGVLTLR